MLSVNSHVACITMCDVFHYSSENQLTLVILCYLPLKKMYVTT